MSLTLGGSHPPWGLGESTALIQCASAGLAPVRSDKWRLHLDRKGNSIFPGIAGGDSGKNKNVHGGWVAATCIPDRDEPDGRFSVSLLEPFWR